MRIEPTPEVSDMLDKAGEAADFIKKLANSNRLMIVCALLDGERSVRDLEDTLGIRQPGLSQQLAELREAGLIVGRKQSKSVFYSLADSRVAAFVGLMHRMFCSPDLPASRREVRKTGRAEPRKTRISPDYLTNRLNQDRTDD